MNRKLLVTLLHKNIEELSMITESFMEMNEYSQTIIQLAKRKTEDIQTIIDELATNKESKETVDIKDVSPIQVSPIELSKPEPEVTIQKNEPIKAEEVIDITSKTEPRVDEDEVIIEVKWEDIENITTTEIETITATETIIEQKIEVDEQSLTSATTTSDTIVTEVTTHTEETKIVTVADKMAHQSISRNEKLSLADNSLSASLANKKVTDIKQAISIGDRFRFQRELFKSNGEDMNKTLTYLNQLATFNEAMDFLKSKYSWDATNEAVEDFYQLVKRKFA